jgi:hypothetical protein
MNFANLDLRIVPECFREIEMFDHRSRKYPIGSVLYKYCPYSSYSIQIGEDTFRGQGIANLKMELRDREDVVQYLLQTIMGDSYEIHIV